MATTIEMIAHCMFHQTPASERERCEECGRELTAAGGKSYCAYCLIERRSAACPICVGRGSS
jgi:predicted amidophosphoribosyltransferase